MTNSYDVGSDFEGATPITGRDENSSEFNLSLRTDGRGKFKAIKFSSIYRASILSELHRIRWNRLPTVAEFPVLHLRRRTSEWVPFVSIISSGRAFLYLNVFVSFFAANDLCDGMNCGPSCFRESLQWRLSDNFYYLITQAQRFFFLGLYLVDKALLHGQLSYWLISLLQMSVLEKIRGE